MNFKRLFRSKTFWTGLGTIALGVYNITKGDVDTGVQLISTGAGMIFIRDAVSNI